MTVTQPLDSALLGLSSPSLEHTPLPMATVEGATHIVRQISPAFCLLTGKTRDAFVGRPFGEVLPAERECLALLDRVYRTGKSASHIGNDHLDASPVFSSFTMWPVMAGGRTMGVVIQAVETAPLHAMTLAMNEALILGSLRQHELTAAAASSNVQLKAEIGEGRQREQDALTLTNEISHRIKNNLQIVIALIGNEARRTAAPHAQGYLAVQARLGAIAKLYDLMSQSGIGQTVPLDDYLREIANTMSASLLGDASGIKIVVEAEALHLDPDRAVPFGLLVNELGTNAIKHAFPGGIGRVTLVVKQAGEEIELTVADDGVGLKQNPSAKAPGKHGSDYVAIFVRQLGGAMTVSGSEETGTTFRIRLPLLVTQPNAPSGA
jgi:two-component sensor histidine kinase